MNINTSDDISVNCASVANGHNAYVHVHDALGGFAMSVFMPNEQTYIIRSKGSTPGTTNPYHLLIVPSNKGANWVHDWLEENEEYYELVGPLKYVLPEPHGETEVKESSAKERTK